MSPKYVLENLFGAEGKCKCVGRGLDIMGSGLGYVKGMALYKGNEECMKVEGTLKEVKG